MGSEMCIRDSEKILTNKDLEKIVDTTDEWIRTRSGIEERRIAEDDECTSDMGYKAAERAILSAGIKKEDIDMIIVATITPDYPWPSSACIIERKLGLKNIPVFDISAACSGFIYALSVASSFIKLGEYKNILVVASEKFSKFVDWEDRGTCVLMGDGAGAFIVGESEESEIIATYLAADGNYLELLYQPGGGSKIPFSKEVLDKRLQFMKMNGKEIYKLAVEKMPDALNRVFEKTKISPDKIDHVIFHQANIRIIESIAKRYNWPKEKVIINIQRYGNTSAATIPIAYAEAVEQGRIKKGDLVAFSAIGGGITWAAALIKV